MERLSLRGFLQNICGQMETQLMNGDMIQV